MYELQIDDPDFALAVVKMTGAVVPAEHLTCPVHGEQAKMSAIFTAVNPDDEADDSCSAVTQVEGCCEKAVNMRVNTVRQVMRLLGSPEETEKIAR